MHGESILGRLNVQGVLVQCVLYVYGQFAFSVKMGIYYCMVPFDEDLLLRDEIHGHSGRPQTHQEGPSLDLHVFLYNRDQLAAGPRGVCEALRQSARDVPGSAENYVNDVLGPTKKHSADIEFRPGP